MRGISTHGSGRTLHTPTPLCFGFVSFWWLFKKYLLIHLFYKVADQSGVCDTSLVEVGVMTSGSVCTALSCCEVPPNPFVPQFDSENSEADFFKPVFPLQSVDVMNVHHLRSWLCCLSAMVDCTQQDGFILAAVLR